MSKPSYRDMVKRELKTPPTKECIEIKGLKVIYFADPVMSSLVESLEDEMQQTVLLPLRNEDIIIKDIECTIKPPFDERHYDILFFDYGGMMYGNSLLEDFSRDIVKEAENRPNTFYVMVSTFTTDAMKDALDIGMFETGFESKVPINIFLSVKDFANYWKKYELGETK